MRASAIKGLLSFGPADGELFLRLKRKRELGSLLTHIQDDQIPLYAVMGESGCGKTSLLRSGLHHVLTQQYKQKFAYWEALAAGAEESLLHAVRASGILPPTESADALLHLELDQPCTVVLDQFEQLDLNDSQHAPIFKLLAAAAEAHPPHRVTWVVAFREEYASAWLKFCHNYGVRAPFLPVERFSKDDAAEIMATLGAEAGIRFERRLLDDFLGTALEEGRMSPVDIGIGLLVLAQLAQQRNKELLTHDDYEFAGRAQGLLAGYVLDRLETIPDPNRGQVLLALLGLFDHDKNQRIAEGLTVEQMAREVELPGERLGLYVARLASRHERVLEEIESGPRDGERRYRLPHERMIGALRRVAGLLLAEVDQARLRLAEAFRVWKQRPQRQYLLAGKDLDLVRGHTGQILRGPPDSEKAEFLRRSLRARLWQRGLAVGLAAVLVAFGLYGYRLNEADRYRDDLSSWGLPRDLYDYQRQLEELSVSANVEHLRWLTAPVKKLSVRGGQLQDLLSVPGTVQELDLSGSSVESLSGLASLQQLTHLSLDLRGSQVETWPALPGELEEFRAPDHRVTDLKSVSDLEALRVLSVEVDGRTSLSGLPDSVRVLELQ